VTGRRPRWRSYLLLARVSNLPTVWTNVLAASVVALAPLRAPGLLWLGAAISLLYMGGMFLNDACDREFDAVARPDRPIPAGDVGAGEAAAIGGALLVAGEIVLAAGRPGWPAMLWSVVLVAAILYYEVRHKRDPLAPLVMGSCRGLVYVTVAAAVTRAVPPTVAGAALLMTLYVAALSWVARRPAPSAGRLIPWLLAGISLVDASFILAYGTPPLALLAVAGFILTLALQRIVPGN
jgi:4-hydroxybenzoate polyprenyltransferase